ncbi:MAG: discoidin domain-containing protein, partial [Bacteroidales bacterium]
LYACSSDSVNCGADQLEIFLSDGLDEDTGKVFQTGDGNWGVNIKPGFGGELKLNIKSDQNWSISTRYLANEESEWILPDQTDSKGDMAVLLDVIPNKSVLYRKAIVTVITKGPIPVSKTITFIQSDADPLIEFNPVSEDAFYDIDTRTLTVNYTASDQQINFWSNIEDYQMRIKAANEGDDISWIKGFNVNKDQGTVTFTLSDNFTGNERLAVIRMDADGFEGVDYYLIQKKSLYKNMLTHIDDESYSTLLDGKKYGFKKRTIVLKFDSEHPLKSEVIDKSTQQSASEWISVRTEGPYIYLDVSSNNKEESREILVKVKTSESGYEEQPAVEWSFTQLHEMLEMSLNQKIEEGNLFFGPVAKNKEVIIGNYKTSDDDPIIETSSDWLSLRLENGIIYLTSMVECKDAAGRIADVTLKNTNGIKEEYFRICQQGTKEINEKSFWKVEIANSHTGAASGKGPELMIDGKWRMNSSDKDSFWESSGGSPDYEFIFDLSESQIFNSLGIMPRQQWPKPAPKQISISISNDKSTWTNLGKFPGFILAEVDETQSYKKQIKWCDFTTIKARYVKLSLGETYWTNTCCVEEVFIEIH